MDIITHVGKILIVFANRFLKLKFQRCSVMFCLFDWDKTNCWKHRNCNLLHDFWLFDQVAHLLWLTNILVWDRLTWIFIKLSSSLHRIYRYSDKYFTSPITSLSTSKSWSLESSYWRSKRAICQNLSSIKRKSSRFTCTCISSISTVCLLSVVYSFGFVLSNDSLRLCRMFYSTDHLFC